MTVTTVYDVERCCPTKTVRATLPSHNALSLVRSRQGYSCNCCDLCIVTHLADWSRHLQFFYFTDPNAHWDLQSQQRVWLKPWWACSVFFWSVSPVSLHNSEIISQPCMVSQNHQSHNYARNGHNVAALQHRIVLQWPSVRPQQPCSVRSHSMLHQHRMSECGRGGGGEGEQRTSQAQRWKRLGCTNRTEHAFNHVCYGNDETCSKNTNACIFRRCATHTQNYKTYAAAALQISGQRNLRPRPNYPHFEWKS